MSGAREALVRLWGACSGRFPGAGAILGVYAVIVALVYSWTMVVSFYKVPSWLHYLTLGQILSLYAYSFLLDQLESIALLAGVLLLDCTLFLPLRNREEFQSRSVVVVLALLAGSLTRLLVYRSYEASAAFLEGELWWWAATLVPGTLLAALLPRSRRFRAAVAGIAERLVVLLYLYLPLSALSLLVVLGRNR